MPYRCVLFRSIGLILQGGWYTYVHVYSTVHVPTRAQAQLSGAGCNIKGHSMKVAASRTEGGVGRIEGKSKEKGRTSEGGLGYLGTMHHYFVCVTISEHLLILRW